MKAANSAVPGYIVILAPSPRKPCHSSPSSSSHGGAYSVRPVRPLTVSVIGTIGACGLVMVQNLPGHAVGGCSHTHDCRPAEPCFFAVRACPRTRTPHRAPRTPHRDIGCENAGMP